MIDGNSLCSLIIIVPLFVYLNCLPMSSWSIARYDHHFQKIGLTVYFAIYNHHVTVGCYTPIVPFSLLNKFIRDCLVAPMPKYIWPPHSDHNGNRKLLSKVNKHI